MRSSLAGLIALICLFAVSIAVRAPHINRPLSTNYEWVTAHTLVTLQIWQEEGIVSHGFRPIYTFPNPNDHYIKCPISGVSDDAGNYYYISYPPFAFIFPHLIFSTFGIHPDVLSLQILNVILHFICAYLIFLLLSSLFKTSTDSKMSMPAIAGAAIYLFSPLALWHHANVYFSDILVQLFFILGVYLSHLYLFRAGHKKPLITWGLFSTIFLMVYTEWVGVLFGCCLIVISFLFRKQKLFSLRLTILTATAMLLAGLLMLFQYSTISGLDDFLQTVLNRYTERSGHTGKNQFYQLNAHLYLGNVYLRNYFPQFVIIGFLGLLIPILKSSFRKVFRTNTVVVLLLALSPALLHHLVLFEFTIVHDMALVKTCVFLSLLTGILLFHVEQTTKQQSGVVFKVVPYFVIVSMLGLSVFLYHAHVFEPEGFSFEELGEQIKKEANPEDTVFFKTTQTLGDFLIKAPENFVIAPQIQYYSGRCIQVVPSLEAAQEHLHKYDKQQGVVFTIENLRYQIENTERISRADSLR